MGVDDSPLEGLSIFITLAALIWKLLETTAYVNLYVRLYCTTLSVRRRLVGGR